MPLYTYQIKDNAGNLVTGIDTVNAINETALKSLLIADFDLATDFPSGNYDIWFTEMVTKKPDELQNRIIVTQDNFTETLGGTIDSTKVYLLDGIIDLGANEITVPEGGMFVQGLDYFVSGLTSTSSNHTMFKNGVTYAGNVKFRNMFFTSSGTNSKIFDLDNDENSGAIEFGSVNLGDFSDTTTSLGTISNYRQFRTEDCGFFRNQDGLTFGGTWSGGFRINDTIVLSQANNSTLFKPAIGLTFGGRCISDINAASVDPTTITFDFIPSNFLLDGGFQLTGASFAPNSSVSVTTDETSIKSSFSNCVEIRNTRAGFEMLWTTETATTLTGGTDAKAEGTTVSSDVTWFTQTGNNEMTYNSSLTKDLLLNANIVVDGGANDNIKLTLRKWDNISSAYVNLKSRTQPINNLVGANDVSFFNINTRVNDLKQNDRIEVWVANATDNTNVTIMEGSELIGEII